MRLSCTSLFRRAAMPVMLAIFCTAVSAVESPMQEASTLIKQSRHAQAVEILDKYLATKPKDAQARFLKGIALTELKKPDAAIVIFQKLTEDYPELPEPYNNLAVIYAQQKNYDKAKSALEMAIRTHPAYATAHENLGDIYARLASQAYDKALQLDSANASAQSKLAMIQDLMVGSAGGRAPTPVAAKAPPPAATTPSPAPSAPPPAAITPPVASPVKPAATVALPKAPPVGEPIKAPTQPNSADPDAVASAVEAWAKAWSRKDVKGYLATYARDFRIPGGKTRAGWETERRQRIEKPGAIEVGVRNIQVSMAGDKATVRFRQSYKSANLDTQTSKRLEMVKRDGRWQIVQESVGG